MNQRSKKFKKEFKTKKEDFKKRAKVVRKRIRKKIHMYSFIAFPVLVSFLITFILARLIVYFAPHFLLTVKGTHIHHFTYGIIILAVAGYLSLIFTSRRSRVKIGILYGVGLGLAIDEFGMWLRLEDDYWIRHSYDALVVVVALLLFLIFLPRSIKVFKKIFNFIFK